MYATKKLTTKLITKHHFHTLKIVEGTPIKSCINEFSIIFINLKIMEISCDNEDQALILFHPLPPSFKHFRDTLEFNDYKLKISKVGQCKEALWLKKLMDKEFVANNRENSYKILFFSEVVLMGNDHPCNILVVVQSRSSQNFDLGEACS